MENKLQIGDMLYCNYRGWGEVTKIIDGGFYVKYNNVEYFQQKGDLGIVLKKNIQQKISKKSSFNNGENSDDRYIEINYKSCVDNLILLESDSIFKEEAIYLSKVRNIIGYNNYKLKDKINRLDTSTRWTYSPTQEEREEFVMNRVTKKRKMKELENLKRYDSEPPYFARMDMESDTYGKLMKVYIGQTSISQNGENLVYDWRSPIGQRYYRRNELQFKLGDDKYITNLIRRFEIKNSKLISYDNEYLRYDDCTKKSNISTQEVGIKPSINIKQVNSYEEIKYTDNLNGTNVDIVNSNDKGEECPNKDVEGVDKNNRLKVVNQINDVNQVEDEIDLGINQDISIVSDPFLIKILKAKRNVQSIGNIISTIQDNQNNIITQELNENIIVQGCAGSGKTMVLLHRLSYLLYNNKNLELNRIKIITPNNLFKGSINKLAKELELDTIEMLSVDEYLLQNIKSYGLNINHKLIEHIVPDEIYNYIYSNLFEDLLEKSYGQYIETLWFRFREYEIDRLELLYKIDVDVREKDGGFTHIRRITEVVIREFNKRKVQYEELEEVSVHEWDIRELNKQSEEILNNIKFLEELIKKEKSLSWIALFEKRNLKNKINQILNGLKCSQEDVPKLKNIVIREKFKQDNFLGYEPKEIEKKLSELINLLKKDDKEFLHTRVYTPLISKVCKQFNYQENLISGRIKLYVLLRLLYIHRGKKDKVDRILCFDEGQDINKFEYKLINDVNGGNVVFNILGDVNQLIKSNRGVNDWSLLSDIKKFKEFQLNENYRNSQEIAKYCINDTGHKMIPIGIDDGKVVILKGENSQLKHVNGSAFMHVIDAFKRDNGLRKVIIVKQIDDEMMRFLSMKFKLSELEIIGCNSNSVDSKKINVMTVKMVKGMEFDITLVLTKNMTRNEKYIALTRALVNSYIIN